MVTHVPPADPSRLRPVTDSQSKEEEYTINADAVPCSSPSHLPRNDSQLVTGSDPPSNSTYASRPPGNKANPDPMLNDNRVTEVTTTHYDASND